MEGIGESRRCLQKTCVRSDVEKGIHNDSWQSCPSYRSAALRRMKRAKGCRCLDRCSGCVRRSRSVLRSWNKTGSRKSTLSSVYPNRLSSGCLRNKKAFCVIKTQNAGETGVIRQQPAPWNAVCCGIRAFRKHAPIFLCGSSADTGRNERRCPNTWRHTSRGGPCAAAESE